VPLTQAAVSRIGSVYLTQDATASGAWAYVDWSDWSSKTKKVKSVAYGLDATPRVSRIAVGAKGPMTLKIPSCTSALYAALEPLIANGSHYTAVLHHAQKGTISRDVEVLDVIAPADAQWAAGDPVEEVTVRLMSFGAV
jgi:hypothetical protein